MVDLKSLLNKPMDDIKAPVALPEGTYYGVIKSQEFGESSKKKTPFCRYTFSLHSAGDDVDQSELQSIDLSTKSLRTDFYITEASEFMLKDFLESCGIKTTGRSLGECIPEAIGQEVKLAVTKRFDERDPSKAFNDVQNAKGTANG